MSWETIAAIHEVQKMKYAPNKKLYSSFEQVYPLSDNSIRRLIRIIQAIESEESQE